ncbi:uncharacterized protein TNCT_681321 [Trichonephila clavata]|uniref:Uncharacterized protein n=1 Tax=Trichonephila clavata TaxID=2740835 RepID=A0A8X6FZJ7_TRICU|nr:uncharacterized protein TNCT_681321 [Trichonephila clavata]
MKCHICCILFLFVLSVKAAAEKDVKKREKTEARQMEYISLINTLLQQTNVLSSVDGAMLAATTLLSSLVTKTKPLLIASALSYILYVATAILLPGPLNRLGLPTLTLPEAEMRGRSVDGGSSSSKIFDSVMADTLVRSIQISPVKNIMTNVSVNVITDTMARVRILSRMLVQQLSLVQRNMVWFSRSLSNECVSKFLCRVGQFTETNFPMASSMLRSLADSYPGMDDYAVAVIRGTSSSNCSLLYPDCLV